MAKARVFLAKARVFLAIKAGVPVDAVMWDGETAYTHPEAEELVAEVDWRNDDLAAIDGATLAQLRPILRRVIRAQRLLIRIAVADPATTDDDPGA